LNQATYIGFAQKAQPVFAMCAHAKRIMSFLPTRRNHLLRLQGFDTWNEADLELSASCLAAKDLCSIAVEHAACLEFLTGNAHPASVGAESNNKK